MRLGAGVFSLAVAVAGLGWWAQVQYAPHIQTVLEQRAVAAVAGSVHGVTVSTEGRDLRVSGLADGPVERDRLIAALDAVDGRRVVVDGLQVLPVIDPFRIGVNWLDGVLEAEGHVPDASAREVLAALGAGSLPLAAGAPDAGWGGAAARGIEALQGLEEGAMALVGRRMSITGLALTPDEGAAVRAVLDRLPEGYQAELGLRYVDDGSPASYALHYAVGAEPWIEGKLPRGLDPAAIVGALGLDAVDDTATRALTGETGVVPPALAALRGWLAEVETLDIAVDTDGVAIDAGFGAGSDLDLLRAALAADLGDGVALTVTEVAAEVDEGTRRSHPVTGRTEELRGGFWVPVVVFDPAPDTCAAQTDAVLAANRIGFVTGSARLDARARTAVNALAGVLGPCLREAGLRAEIGGHTDNTGSDATNLALSRQRAQAVRAALIARGLPAAGLSAAGYGAAEPIADNTTDEGRAANRRTAVRWIE